MTNVVGFPALLTGPITEGQTDKIHSQAFRDLEGRLSDCVCMARIARELAANAKIDDDELIFAIGHAAPGRLFHARRVGAAGLCWRKLKR
jgi:hypothetical protein